MTVRPARSYRASRSRLLKHLEVHAAQSGGTEALLKHLEAHATNLDPARPAAVREIVREELAPMRKELAQLRKALLAFALQDQAAA